MFCVYKHTSPNGKVYIGITSKKPKERWANGQGYISNPHFYRAIKKYGWENFEHEILYEGLTEEQANIIEQMMISAYKSTNRHKGYNISLGGGAMTGRKHTESAKCKMREKAKGRKVWCEGLKLSDEHRKHLSESHKGLKQSEETKKKRAEKLKGHRVDRKALEKAVIKMSISGEYLDRYESMTKAALSLGVRSVAHISECCRGKRGQFMGFKWKFDERRTNGERIKEFY